MFDHFAETVALVTIEKKYVNMADVNFRKNSAAVDHHRSSDDDALNQDPAVDDIFETIELLFFAYRDFVSDPDEILKEFGFGRAHHRVIHFVNRNPGMRVADLLDTLKITKQSLARVLRQLVETGFVEQKTGPRDRRQRLLYTTDSGQDLADRLAEPQRARIARALNALGPDNRDFARVFLYSLIDEGERAHVTRIAGKR